MEFWDVHCNLPNVLHDFQKQIEAIDSIENYKKKQKNRQPLPSSANLEICWKELWPLCTGIISVASDQASLKQTIEFATQHPKVYFAAGIHPLYGYEYSETAEKELIAAMKHPRCVAWGEIGLDYHDFGHSEYSKPPIQQQLFRQQITLALQTKKTIIIHTREAEQDTLSIMKELIPVNWPIHVHCFTDSESFLMDLISFFPNLFISFSGILLFSSAKIQQSNCKKVPLNRLMIETDAPFLCPQRGWINHPGFIPQIISFAFSLIQPKMSIEEFSSQIIQNAKECYSIKD